MKYEIKETLNLMDLVDFLEWHGVLEKFERNLECDLENTKCNLILGAFIWSGSNEGLAFWSDLCHQWEILCAMDEI